MKSHNEVPPTPNAWLHSLAIFLGFLILILLVAGALAILGLGSVAPPAFMNHFTVFILAIFVGYQVIWSVTAALHTPLMSGTNAISGRIRVGAL